MSSNLSWAYDELDDQGIPFFPKQNGDRPLGDHKRLIKKRISTPNVDCYDMFNTTEFKELTKGNNSVPSLKNQMTELIIPCTLSTEPLCCSPEAKNPSPSPCT